MDFNFSEKPISKSISILSLSGRLNAVNAVPVKEKIKEIVSRGYIHLILDLSAITFIDSSGLATLVSGLKAVREKGGSLKLSGLNDQARTVLRITLLEKVFEIYTTAEIALQNSPHEST